MSVLSPTFIVRFALILCSLTVLVELWPTIALIVSARRDDSTSTQAQNDPATQVGGVYWLRLILGVVTCVLGVAATFVVPHSHQDVEEQSRKRLAQAEELLREATTKGDEADATIRSARILEDASKAERAQAQLTSDGAELTRQRAQRELAEAKQLSQELDLARDRQKRMETTLAEAERKMREDQQSAARARGAAEAEASKIIRAAGMECTAQRTEIGNLRDAADRYAAEQKQAAESDRRECNRMLSEAVEATRRNRTLEAECVRREQNAATMEDALAKKEALLNEQRVCIDQTAARATADQAAAARELAEAQMARESARTALLKMETTKETLDRVRKSLWPPWIVSGSVLPSILEIEQFAGGGNTNAAVVLSYLQLLQAVENHPGFCKEFNYLWPTVRELGRFLASLLADNGHSPPESAECLTEWAKALNQASRGRFTVSVPALGSPFNSSRMESKSNIQAVSRVINWSVSNSKSIIASKAEVL